jgi:hypothetical protein
MNSASTTTEIRSALASAAKSYAASRRVRFQELAPFKDEVRELRSRGAAFMTIAEILKAHSVNVSHETVRQFYLQEIEKKPARRRRSRNGMRRKTPNSKRPETRDNESRPLRAATSKAERGPRIARIEDL